MNVYRLRYSLIVLQQETSSRGYVSKGRPSAQVPLWTWDSKEGLSRTSHAMEHPHVMRAPTYCKTAHLIISLFKYLQLQTVHTWI